MDSGGDAGLGNVGRQEEHYLHFAALFRAVAKKLAQKGQVP